MEERCAREYEMSALFCPDISVYQSYIVYCDLTLVRDAGTQPASQVDRVREVTGSRWLVEESRVESSVVSTVWCAECGLTILLSGMGPVRMLDPSHHLE